MRFKDKQCMQNGAIDTSQITRGKDGKIMKVVIRFDDDDKEEHDWPNKSIAVIGGMGKAEERKRRG